ncbi:MAG: Os1348 family NHLP clan protein [Chloroflexota bacterium]|nr:hypothetical protein [Chloroflexota bacterium]
MAMDEIKAIIARALNDDEFKHLLMENPEQAVRDGGFNLSLEEIETLKTDQLLGQLKDEVLEKRDSKGFFRIGP